MSEVLIWRKTNHDTLSLIGYYRPLTPDEKYPRRVTLTRLFAQT
jgi:hypothetical protein